jgi:hypothetical protein
MLPLVHNGKASIRLAFLDIFVGRGGDWKCIFEILEVIGGAKNYAH